MTAPSIDYGSDARLGMLLPSGNQAAEAQFRSMLPATVSLHVTRLKLVDSAEKSLLGMADRLEEAVSLLADARVNLMLFHCTAVSTFSLKLELAVLSRAASASPVPVTSTSRALTGALEALGARRIVMLSPYSEAISKREAIFFEAHGLQVVGNHGLNCNTADEMMAITPNQWRDFAVKNADEQADVYVLSCTNVRNAEVINELENVLARPVITSNTAAAWHCLRLLKINSRIQGFGVLAERW